MSKNPTTAEEQYELAKSYERGYDDVPKDKEKAWYWYVKAAENGNVDAQFQLGETYSDYFGYGEFMAYVPKDIKKGVYWYTKAAEQGHQSAQFALGNYFWNICYNWKESRKIDKATFWFIKAAEQGCVVSMKCLGDISKEERDKRNAKFWYAKAAELGDEDAKKELQKLKPGTVILPIIGAIVLGFLGMEVFDIIFFAPGWGFIGGAIAGWIIVKQLRKRF